MCTDPAQRTKLVEEIKESSWAYHALVMVPHLTDDEKDMLITRIVEGTFPTSWANRAMAWHKEYMDTHNKQEFFSARQREALMSAFAR